MPAAYADHVRPFFRSRATSGNKLRVTGCDLVTPITSSTTLYNPEAQLMAVITANPAYWSGTKVAAIAAAYFNYRPIRMAFHYVPQVPVTYGGTVVAGTLWAG